MKPLMLVFGLFVLGATITAYVMGRAPDGESKRSVENIHYKIVTIEGRKFIATPTYYNYWTLAGPID